MEDQVEWWQTPATDSFRSRGGDRKDEMGLDQQARFFPTPAARDYRGPNAKPYSERGGASERGTASELHRPLFAPGPNDPRWPEILRERPDLAPALCDFERFVLALRCADLLPLGVECTPKRVGKALREALSTKEAKSRFRELVDGLARRAGERTAALRVIGNGVVPLQAAAAFSVLARRNTGLMEPGERLCAEDFPEENKK